MKTLSKQYTVKLSIYHKKKLGWGGGGIVIFNVWHLSDSEYPYQIYNYYHHITYRTLFLAIVSKGEQNTCNLSSSYTCKLVSLGTK